jgi:hypothetical protein
VRVDVRPRKRNAPRPAEKSAPSFLQWLRGRDCLAVGGACFGRIEAAHVDFAGGKGIGTKVADRYAVPLCSFHHAKQHRWGWKTFQAAFQIDALAAAEAYWRAWPGRIAWERKQEANNG